MDMYEHYLHELESIKVILCFPQLSECSFGLQSLRSWRKKYITCIRCCIDYTAT